MSRITDTFEQCRREKRKALVTYVTCGVPDFDRCVRIAGELIAAGSDIIELGVPFSDPMADGPVIQKAGALALTNHTTLDDVFAMAMELRKRFPATPLILFSYYNVLFRRKRDRVCREAAAAGIDAFLVVDLPLEEQGELLPFMDQYALELIPLISPASDAQRIQALAQKKNGFLYYITVRGVTGTGSGIASDVASHLKLIKSITALPVVAGFGITSAASAKNCAEAGDGVVVGSAIVSKMMECPNGETAVALVKEIAEALRS